MNKKQKVLVAVAVGLMVVTFLFPAAGARGSRGCTCGVAYLSILWRREPMNNGEMFVEWTLIAGIGTAGWLSLRNSKPHIENKPVELNSPPPTKPKGLSASTWASEMAEMHTKYPQEPLCNRAAAN